MYVVVIVLYLIGLSGCKRGGTYQMANELRFSVDDISDLTISYDEEKVTFLESDNDVLVVREYMTVNKKSYYAKVNQRDNRLKISEGGKPFFKSGFSRYTKIYLPVSYEGSLSVTTTDGDINLSDRCLQTFRKLSQLMDGQQRER